MSTNNAIDAALPISGANGGTGVANTGRTITIAGNVITAGAHTLSGAFASTFTFTNTTNVTFPESGTLATTAGTVANADNIGIANDTTTNATMYPVWVTANTGYLPPRVTSTKLSFNPSTGLLTATLYAGAWNGSVISGTYGGTGVNNGASTITIGGNITFSGAFTFAGTVTGNTTVTFPTSGTLATTAQIPTGAALTKVDDTNVTLTLGGSPSTALINASSLTLGWAGQLGLTRGGSNASLTASLGGIVYSTASAMAILSGTATANLPLLSGSSAAPSWGSFALSLGGALTTAGAFTMSGAFGFTGTLTNTTAVTFPTSGTLATTSQVVTSNNVTGTSASLAVNNLYVANNAGLVTLTLPAAAAVGDRIFIRGSGAGGWIIAQNASQILHAGSSASTTGVSGSLASSNRYDCVELTCIVANLEFNCCGIQGNLTVV